MISIVIPIYNVEKYIHNCLKSVLEQSFQDYELILVDDGSSDSSVEIAEELLSQSNVSWKTFRKENGGQSSARNYGLKQANGEYVLYLDSDDVISKDFLKRLYEAFDKETNFTFCDFKYVKQQVPPEAEKTNFTEYTKDELLNVFLKRTIGFVVPSMMFRKDFLINNNLLFREGIRFSEDQLFIWEVFFKSNKAKYIPSKMYGYYMREKSIMTGSAFNRIKEGFEVYSSFCDELKDKYPNNTSLIEKILPRWELGTLYSLATLMDYSQYKQIYEMMDGRTILKRISGIGENKAYLLALVSSISPKLLYELCKRMNLNE